MGWLENSISKQRSFIEGLLLDPLSHLADICDKNWEDRVLLDQQLSNFLKQKSDHRCRVLYAIDKQGAQYSSNIQIKLLMTLSLARIYLTVPSWMISIPVTIHR